jgi:hypothetical protein
MKLVFEKDIPELAGKSWSEKRAMRLQARKCDRRIFLRSMLIAYVFPFFLIALMKLRKNEILPTLLWVMAIYFIVCFPIYLLMLARWVNPLVKEALQKSRASTQSSASSPDEAAARRG